MGSTGASLFHCQHRHKKNHAFYISSLSVLEYKGFTAFVGFHFEDEKAKLMKCYPRKKTLLFGFIPVTLMVRCGTKINAKVTIVISVRLRYKLKFMNSGEKPAFLIIKSSSHFQCRQKGGGTLIKYI